LVAADHVADREGGPQGGRAAVAGDDHPDRPAVGVHVLAVHRPRDEPEVELAYPHLTALVRRHAAVDPLLGALLRLRVRHHRGHPSTGTARAKPPSTISSATVSSSGG